MQIAAALSTIPIILCDKINRIVWSIFQHQRHDIFEVRRQPIFVQIFLWRVSRGVFVLSSVLCCKVAKGTMANTTAGFWSVARVVTPVHHFLEQVFVSARPRGEERLALRPISV